MDMFGTDREKNRVNLCGLWIDNISLNDAISRMTMYIQERRPVYIVTPNVDHVVKIHHDCEFRNSYREASLVLCDGAPLIWASRFLGSPVKERICGSDLFVYLAEIAARKGYKLFFLGGRPGSAQKAAEMFARKHPGVQVVGVYAPPFGFEKDPDENEKIVSLIKRAQPDILLVGVGTPKQEKWIYAHHQQAGVPVTIGIGASFEFAAGIIKRAPFWIRRGGFEWLWRLILEPNRLWKRYLVDDLEFFVLILKQKWKLSR
jgi:N-acetylglucosaminyldiphosphoundecaprenol N-acetyl-beta-D-mannosaminyltransferase